MKESIRTWVSKLMFVRKQTSSLQIDETRHIMYHLEFENYDSLSSRVGYIQIYNLGPTG